MSTYIYTVTAAALTVSVLAALAGQGAMGRLIKVIAGIFIALTVISPLLKLDLPDPEAWISGLETDGASAATSGTELADEALRQIIKERTEAYILDKTARYGSVLEVDVQLDEQGIPAAVTLSGEASPYARTKLARIMAADLGLGEEVQQWIGLP